MLGKFSEWLKENNWSFEVNDAQEECELLGTFKNLPKSFLDFLRNYKSVLSSDEKTWFICTKEYNDKSEYAYKWNEFESISLEAAAGDDEWEKHIKDWWKNKLPIVMSVKDGYSFYAIDILKDNCIVKGEEPEFEEATVVASSFEDLH